MRVRRRCYRDCNPLRLVAIPRLYTREENFRIVIAGTSHHKRDASLSVDLHGVPANTGGCDLGSSITPPSLATFAPFELLVCLESYRTI